MEVKILEVCQEVLHRLTKMSCAVNQNCESEEQLIFPSKLNNTERRVSEQELRFLFVEVFKQKYPKLFYSIETPTFERFKLGKFLDLFKSDEGRSASHDMSIYYKATGSYTRLLNVEFKHSNSKIENTAKDILKLICEEQNGVFIHMLENTDSNTLNSVFEKFQTSFTKFAEKWKHDKYIEIIILSIDKKQKKLIYHKIDKSSDIETVFKIGKVNINDFVGTEGWKYYSCIDPLR